MAAGPKLINSGKTAIEAIAKVLPRSSAITVQSNLGPVELKPGTIFSENRMLVTASTMTVVYVVDDRLYEWGTQPFIRDEYLNAFVTGAKRASHWVTIAQAEMALLMGIFVPWYLLLGLSCAKAGLFYKANQRNVDEAFRQAPKVMRLLQDLRRRSPALFNTMMKSMAKDLVVNLPSGVSAEDVAFFVGRVIKGAAGAGPELTIGALVKIVGTVGALVTASHLPAIAAHTASHVAGKKAAELKRALNAAGYTVTEAEAKTILTDVMSRPDGVAMLQQLETACAALVPTLNQLKSAYGALH